MRRLLLLRHGPTAASRRRAFPGDEPLDPGGAADAARLRGTLPRSVAALCSPARRCRETAVALGLPDPSIEPRLAECDFGRWAGRALPEIDREEPAGVAAWMGDPGAAPHDGESLLDLLARVGSWLEDLAGTPDPATVAVTHGGVVRAAIVHALGAPPRAVWRVDVPPLSLTELRVDDGGWTVRLPAPLEAPA